MISPPLRERLAKAERNAHLIWGALMLAVPLYGFIAWQIASTRGAAQTPPALALPALALLTVIDLVVGWIWWRRSFTDAALRRAPDRPTSTPLPADLPPRDQRLFAVSQYVQSRQIVCSAFFEAVAIYGVILAILGHPFARALPFLAVALAALALHRPRLVEMVERADRLLPPS